MNKHYSQIAIAMLLAIFSIAGCTEQANIQLPDVGIPSNELNTKFQLSNPSGLGNTYKNGDELTLIINVTAEDWISFPEDYGVRLFIFKEKKWIEITNRMKYPETSNGDLIFGPTGDPFKTGMASAAPFMENLSERVPLRIYLVGKVYRDGHLIDETAASYIDVVLKP